jgi:hypothetical protein
MRVLRPATLGVALALGATGAHAQSAITRQITTEPVETTVVQGPEGTVITRRPVAVPVAPLAAPAVRDVVRVGTDAYMDSVHEAPVMTRPPRSIIRTERVRRTTRETVGAAVTHHVTHTRSVTRTVRRVASPLVLAPVQRRVIYRTIVQQQVIPPVAASVVPAPRPGYPPYPAPAYSERTVVVAPATTGYGAAAYPADYDDDGYAEAVPPARVPVRYVVGSRLPSNVVLAPMPAGAAVAVPAARAYSYAMIDNRVLLVDPASYTVVADITP